MMRFPSIQHLLRQKSEWRNQLRFHCALLYIIHVLSCDDNLIGRSFKMLLRVIFLILFSQTFMKQLVCSLESKGTYFKRVSDMPNSVANDENFLSLKLFSCGRDNECSNVVESQLGKMKGKGTVWSKVKEPGLKDCFHSS